MNFIKNNKLNVHQEMVTHSTPTYHNDGKSTSQVDYIFSNNNTTIVMEHDLIKGNREKGKEKPHHIHTFMGKS